MCSGSEASTDPMSTGNEFLDKALVLHLNNCNRLLLVRTGAGGCCGEVSWGGKPGAGWVPPGGVSCCIVEAVGWLLRSPFGLALQKLGTFGPLRCQEMYALDRLLREAQVLEIVCQLTEERAGAAGSAADGKAAWPRGPPVPRGLCGARLPSWAHAGWRAGVPCLLP